MALADRRKIKHQLGAKGFRCSGTRLREAVKPAAPQGPKRELSQAQHPEAVRALRASGPSRSLDGRPAPASALWGTGRRWRTTPAGWVGMCLTLWLTIVHAKAHYLQKDHLPDTGRQALVPRGMVSIPAVGRESCAQRYLLPSRRRQTRTPAHQHTLI